MDEILRQLGGLLLGSVPTMILFLFVVVLYQTLVYTPLRRVLAERRARTAGAVEQANQAIAAAEAKAQEYEAKLRAVRLQVFEAREERRRQWNSERETALGEARAAAHQRMAEAKAALGEETEAAHRALERAAEELAKEILKSILPPESAPELVPAGSSR
jgi:F-type H+-transporting ATPase subunit b